MSRRSADERAAEPAVYYDGDLRSPAGVEWRRARSRAKRRAALRLRQTYPKTYRVLYDEELARERRARNECIDATA